MNKSLPVDHRYRNKRALRMLGLVSIAFIAVYSLCFLYVYQAGDALAFDPPEASYTPQDCKFLELPNGDRIAYFFYRTPGAQKTLLYAHGSAVDIGTASTHLQELGAMGYNVMLFDYPGFGCSEGELSEKHTYQSIHAVYMHMVNRLGIAERDIILYGRSVGCAPTLYLASLKPDVGGVVVVSPFLSSLRVATGMQLFPYEVFDNSRMIRKLKTHVWIMHGRWDETVPVWHAERLHQINPGRTTLLRLDHYGHADIHDAPEHKGLLKFFMLDEQRRAGIMAMAEQTHRELTAPKPTVATVY